MPRQKPAPEPEPRDPVNCIGCRLDWIVETRAILDAMASQIEAEQQRLVPSHNGHEPAPTGVPHES
jgi:hypothetical protein